MKKALDSGWWVNPAIILGKEKMATFCKKGVSNDDQTGPLKTRIDGFLLNRPAAEALVDMRPLDKIPGSGPDHVPIALDLNLRAFSEIGEFWIRPTKFPMKQLPDYTIEQQEILFNESAGPLLNKFEEACTNEEMSKADLIWHSIAVKYLQHALEVAEVKIWEMA